MDLRDVYRQRGATVIETVIMLPLFLMGILFVLWIGYIVNTKNSLISAVQNGVRLAVTRGKAGLYEGIHTSGPVGAIPGVDLYVLSDDQGGAGDGTLLVEVQGLLMHNVEGDAATLDNIYRPAIEPVFQSLGYDSLSDLPAYFTYALIYIHKAMRMSLGDNLTYPCNPEDPQNQDIDNCLFCRPVHPITRNDWPFIPDDELDATLLLRRITIRCDLRAGGFIVRPLTRFLNFFSGVEGGDTNSGQIMRFAYHLDAFDACRILKETSEDADPRVRFCCDDRYGNEVCF